MNQQSQWTKIRRTSTTKGQQRKGWLNKWNVISGWGMRIHPDFFFSTIIVTCFLAAWLARLSSSNQVGNATVDGCCDIPRAKHRLDVSKTLWTSGISLQDSAGEFAGFFWTMNQQCTSGKNTPFFGGRSNIVSRLSPSPPPKKNPPESREV